MNYDNPEIICNGYRSFGVKAITIFGNIVYMEIRPDEDVYKAGWTSEKIARAIFGEDASIELINIHRAKQILKYSIIDISLTDDNKLLITDEYDDSYGDPLLKDH